MHKVRRPAVDLAGLFRHGGRSVTGPELASDFSVNVNPLGPPSGVLNGLREELDAIARYPDSDCTALAARLAAHHDVAPEQIVIGNGSTELIYAIARAYRPRRAAIMEPTFTEYLRASLRVGADAEHWLAEPPHFDLEPFEPGEADLVWLCNPNNPTGRLWLPNALAGWMRNHPATQFVVDEAFLPFLDEEQEHSLIPALSRFPNVSVIRSMTKVYALAGLRLGYAVANPRRADAIRSQIPPWSVNHFAQAAGLAALADHDFLARTRQWFRAERRAFDQGLISLSQFLEVVPSRANFNLLRIRCGCSAWLAELLAQHGLIVRDASNFIGLSEGHVRVAVRTAPENRRLLAELRSLFLHRDQSL
jgi:threonine-phosphate decarboxylase